MLGGFTTFSSFSLEAAGYLSAGQTGLALGYVAASVVGAIVALYAGAALVHAL
jgi:CrcB protein